MQDEQLKYVPIEEVEEIITSTFVTTLEMAKDEKQSEEIINSINSNYDIVMDIIEMYVDYIKGGLEATDEVDETKNIEESAPSIVYTVRQYNYPRVTYYEEGHGIVNREAWYKTEDLHHKGKINIKESNIVRKKVPVTKIMPEQLIVGDVSRGFIPLTVRDRGDKAFATYIANDVTYGQLARSLAAYFRMNKDTSHMFLNGKQMNDEDTIFTLEDLHILET